MSDIRLVFFDVDGTLVNTRREVPPSAQKAIKALQARGIKTAIASGRPPFACVELIKHCGLVDAGMFYTGGLLFDPRNNYVLQSHALARDVLEDLIGAARDLDLHLELYTRDNYAVERRSEYTDYHTSYLNIAPEVCDFDAAIASQEILKALVIAGSQREKSALAELREKFPALGFYTGHGPDRPDIDFVSILDSAANKRAAFSILCNHHGVEPAQVMACGDAESDITFLQLAGQGVAMGNANDEVKASAEFITGHVDSDGLAFALDRLV